MPSTLYDRIVENIFQILLRIGIIRLDGGNYIRISGSEIQVSVVFCSSPGDLKKYLVWDPVHQILATQCVP